MAAPTQILPGWLSYSATIITNAGGQPLTTSTSVIYLPLTYYGPSIPLGHDWTYGGLAPPTSTKNSVTHSSPSAMLSTLSASVVSDTFSHIPSVTPSSFSPAPSATHSTFTPTSLTTPQSPIVASTTSPASSLSLPSSNLPSASSSTTPSPTPIAQPQPSGVAKTERIGIILGTILGSVLFLLICLIIKMLIQRRRSQKSDTRFTMLTPIDDDYFLVGIQGRSAGEGSPRGSGEEADPFLRRGGSPTTPTMRQTGSQATYPSMPVTSNVKRVPIPAASLSSNNTSNSTSTNSGYGVLLEHPTLGSIHRTNERRGNILTIGELQRVDEEFGPAQQTPLGDHLSLLPPPRLVVPPQGLSTHASQGSLASHRSSYPTDANEATLLTARRVKAEDLGPRSPPQLERPDSGPSSRWMGGLGVLTGLNWFKNTDSTSRRNSRAVTRPASSLIAKGLSDTDIETGRALLGEQMRASYSEFGVGLGLEDQRPNSGDSAQSGESGNTIYHDANSSSPSLTPLPRALTPGGHSGNNNSRPTADAGERPSDVAAHSGATIPDHSVLPGVDVLDMPVPPSMSTFASSSTLRDTDSSTSGARTIPLPPGLGALPTPRVWREGSDGELPCPGSFSARDNRSVIGAGVLFDVLEDEPPHAGEGWKSLAGVVNSGLNEGDRRTTFGLPQFVHPHDHTVSERGSLHSMRSHLSPNSSRSAGSSPASRRLLSGSAGSGSSRPTVLSATGSGSFASGGSLSHSGSISSDGRKRTRTPGPMSPALSAFGRPSGHAVSLTTGSSITAQHEYDCHNAGAPMTTATIDTNNGVVHTIAARPTSPGLHSPRVP